MPYVVEDGSGLAAANQYVSAAYVAEYALDAGLTVPAGSVDGAIVRASRWIDGRFGARFSGSRLQGRAQGLEWPRTGATDFAGAAVASNEVPAEIQRATAEAALRELRSPGSLSPDQAQGAAGASVKRVRKKVGPLETETEYSDSGSNWSASGFPAIDAILAGLLGGRSSSLPVIFVV